MEKNKPTNNTEIYTPILATAKNAYLEAMSYSDKLASCTGHSLKTGLPPPETGNMLRALISTVGKD